MKPVITIGETMGLFRATSMGSLAQVNDFHLGIGGAESNVAIGLARLGTPAAWVGRVGADGMGERIVRELRAEGVEPRVIVDPVARTGMMIKEQRTAHATRVLYYRGDSAGSRITPEDVAAAGIDSASLLHVTGITSALSDSAAAAIDAAIDIAADAGVPISFDVNHRPSLWVGRDPRPVYRAVAARATVVFAGLDEGILLANGATSAGDVASEIAALGPGQVVIKLGGDGAIALVDGVSVSRAAIPIREVDTVGAGDAFVAGYLAELLGGGSVDDRLTIAVTAGAFACLHPGDWEGYARRDELGLLTATDPVSR